MGKARWEKRQGSQVDVVLASIFIFDKYPFVIYAKNYLRWQVDSHVRGRDWAVVQRRDLLHACTEQTAVEICTR